MHSMFRASRFAIVTAAIAAAIGLSACGGGGSSTTATNPTVPAPAAVTGVATPQAVSVVTAN